MSVSVNEVWYVPVLDTGRRRPLVYYEHMAKRRRVAVANIIMNSYSGSGDWNYLKKLGWSIERVTISNGSADKTSNQ